MLKEGKERIYTYIVEYIENDKRQSTYFQTSSAQKAVDCVRNSNHNIKIVEVAKVVNNWR